MYKYVNQKGYIIKMNIYRHTCGTLKCENAAICEKVAKCEKNATLNVKLTLYVNKLR